MLIAMFFVFWFVPILGLSPYWGRTVQQQRKALVANKASYASLKACILAMNDLSATLPGLLRHFEGTTIAILIAASGLFLSDLHITPKHTLELAFGKAIFGFGLVLALAQAITGLRQLWPSYKKYLYFKALFCLLSLYYVLGVLGLMAATYVAMNPEN